MAFEVDFTDQTGTTGFAHKELLLRIQALAEANGWITLRYATGVAPTVGTGLQDELILRGEGLSGDKEIYVGFRTYESSTADYYNIAVAGFTGYVPANTWAAQPGFVEMGVCGHNQHIDYWLVVNAQRIALAMKVGTPVYESCYAGFILPYATPSQYPYPLCIVGMLNGPEATRYSDTSHTMGYRGNSTKLKLRWLDGTWKQPSAMPWMPGDIAPVSFATVIRPLNDQYPLFPLELVDTAAGNILGRLDGIFGVSYFNNTVESTIDTPASETLVCIQDVARTGFGDMYALELS